MLKKLTQNGMLDTHDMCRQGSKFIVAVTTTAVYYSVSLASCVAIPVNPYLIIPCQHISPMSSGRTGRALCDHLHEWRQRVGCLGVW